MEDEEIAPNTDSRPSQYMGRKSRQYIIFQHTVQARLSALTDGISCMLLTQYPRLPFCVLI